MRGLCPRPGRPRGDRPGGRAGGSEHRFSVLMALHSSHSQRQTHHMHRRTLHDHTHTRLHTGTHSRTQGHMFTAHQLHTRCHLAPGSCPATRSPGCPSATCTPDQVPAGPERDPGSFYSLQERRDLVRVTGQVRAFGQSRTHLCSPPGNVRPSPACWDSAPHPAGAGSLAVCTARLSVCVRYGSSRVLPLGGLSSLSRRGVFLRPSRARRAARLSLPAQASACPVRQCRETGP